MLLTTFAMLAIGLALPSASQAALVYSTWTVTALSPVKTCSTAPATKPRPLRDVTVQVRQGQGIIAAGRADTDGTVTLSGRAIKGAPVQIRVVFATPRVLVSSGDSGPPLAMVRHQSANPFGSTSGTYKVVATGNEIAVANTFRWAGASSRAADFANPRQQKMPRVRYALEYNHDLTRRIYEFRREGALTDPTDPIVYVGTPWREFEGSFLSHEMGHHLLYHAARVHSNGAAHKIRHSYPNNATMVYDEGFSNAFAAIVVNNDGQLHERCAFFMNMGKTFAPAKPAPNQPRYAAFNEVRNAAVFFNLARENAISSSPTHMAMGLGAVLSAARQWRGTTGTFPDTMRELRDAVARSSLEDTARQALRHQRIFGKQGIRWGYRAQLEYESARTPTDAGTYMNQQGIHRITMRITGPGNYECVADTDLSPFGPMRSYLIEESYSEPYPFHYSEGPQSIAWFDDCLRFDAPALTQVLPPVAGNSQADPTPWKIEVQAECDPNNYDPQLKADTISLVGQEAEGWFLCPQSATYPVNLAIGTFDGNCMGIGGCPPPASTAESYQAAEIDLPMNEWVTLLQWRDYNGFCRAHASIDLDRCD